MVGSKGKGPLAGSGKKGPQEVRANDGARLYRERGGGQELGRGDSKPAGVGLSRAWRQGPRVLGEPTPSSVQARAACMVNPLSPGPERVPPETTAVRQEWGQPRQASCSPQGAQNTPSQIVWSSDSGGGWAKTLLVMAWGSPSISASVSPPGVMRVWLRCTGVSPSGPAHHSPPFLLSRCATEHPRRAAQLFLVSTGHTAQLDVGEEVCGGFCLQSPCLNREGGGGGLHAGILSTRTCPRGLERRDHCHMATGSPGRACKVTPFWGSLQSGGPAPSVGKTCPSLVLPTPSGHVPAPELLLRPLPPSAAFRARRAPSAAGARAGAGRPGVTLNGSTCLSGSSSARE